MLQREVAGGRPEGVDVEVREINAHRGLLDLKELGAMSTAHTNSKNIGDIDVPKLFNFVLPIKRNFSPGTGYRRFSDVKRPLPAPKYFGNDGERNPPPSLD